MPRAIQAPLPPWAGALAEKLRRQRTEDGGYAPSAGFPARSDTTAWAGLALQTAGFPQPEASAWLERHQGADGSVWLQEAGPRPEQRPGQRYQLGWVTPIAVMLWSLNGDFAAACRRGSAFLTESHGRQIPTAPEIIGHDGMLRGWSWISATHSWVEPTSQAMLALSGSAPAPEVKKRLDEGRALLLNRQLPEGGWNYGNTRTLGTVLRPTPESTALALAALEATGGAEGLEASRRYLIRETGRDPAPLSIGWAAIALRRQLPPQALLESLRAAAAREPEFAPYPLEWLAVLLLGTASALGQPLPWDPPGSVR